MCWALDEVLHTRDSFSPLISPQRKVIHWITIAGEEVEAQRVGYTAQGLPA